MLTGKDRKYLRAEANQLKPIFQIGKAGVNPNLIKQIDEALEARELIKISLLQNTMEDKEHAADEIAAATHAEIVQIIGQTIILYRTSTDNQKLNLPSM
ncbi:ribosome assembly RNA-binding protein YhbY [Salsuginibacillus kocurii]|uniref:ribosome assembly RNA-binding protein YhbY n=1 Tax=Salsuginibacillus kocurii TaxID=427078 RepID=UPI00037443C5|nr:ribosome assembly RNA-binding protein YhbY [Salsuginibacillus kocurii]